MSDAPAATGRRPRTRGSVAGGGASSAAPQKRASRTPTPTAGAPRARADAAAGGAAAGDVAAGARADAAGGGADGAGGGDAAVNPSKRIRSALDAMLDEASGAPQPTPKPATADELVAGWCLYRDMYGKNGMAAGGAKSEKPEGSIRPPATPVTSEPADAADSTTPLTPRRCEIAMWAP